MLTGCSHIDLPVVWIPKRAEARHETSTRIVFTDDGVRVVCEGAVLQTKHLLE